MVKGAGAGHVAGAGGPLSLYPCLRLTVKSACPNEVGRPNLR
jgi:hypothetical protein